MTPCNKCRAKIDQHLDRELNRAELALFERHLKSCLDCEEAFVEERVFRQLVWNAKPLVTAPQSLRAQVTSILEHECVVRSTPQCVANKTGEVRRPLLSFRPILSVVVMLAVIVGVAVVWAGSIQQARANSFVDMAVYTHEEQERGKFPLDLQSGSEAEVAAWFAKRVPYRFRLPQYGPGEQAAYTLKGGRLITFQKVRTVYLSYELQRSPVSLFVIADSQVRASGGELTSARNITFHSRNRGQFQVVTWTVHGLTYALVSKVNRPARESCVICHVHPKA